MPPKKKKSSQGTARTVILLTVLAALLGMAYLGLLWWRSRQVTFVEYAEFGIPMPANYGIHGIDVSRYQRRISWKAVRQMEVEGIRLGFAFIKATEGLTKVDPFFKRNWRNSKKEGIVRGAYHFFIATKDGKEQARNFIKAVELESGDLPPVLDVEQTFGVKPEKLREEIREWLHYMEGYYDVKPIIYTGADFYKRHLEGHFDDYPLWVAHYLQRHQPRVSREWSFWQHSEKGKVDGILSHVDFNVFNGDSVEFRSLLVP